MLWLLALTLLGLVTTADDEATLLTYFIEYEEDQDDDFIEVGLAIKVESTSLSEAIAEAQGVADKVTKVGSKYCNDFLKKSKKKPNCKEVVEVRPH